jgi:outer membrane protein assembly factor BamB
MNLRKRYCILAASAMLAITGLNSCKKDYSPDTPLPVTYSQSLFVGSDNQIVYALDPISLEKKWKFSADGEILSTPLVKDKVLYVGTSKGTLYSINAQTGVKINSISYSSAIVGTPIFRGDMLLVVEGTKIHTLKADLTDYYVLPSTNTNVFDMGGTINSSPAIHDIAGGFQKAIFISGMNNNVVALNDLLQVLWTFTPAEPGAFYSSPCVVNDSFVYVGNDNGNVYAIKSLNGTQKWSFITGAQVRSSPIQIGGNVLVGSDDRNFYSVDSATGLLRWKVQTGDAIQSSPVVFNQNVYFGSYDSKFYCIDIIDGHVVWEVPTQALIKSSPVAFNGDIYFGGFDKLLYRLDATTGAQRVTPYRINGQMATSPVIDDISKVYVPSISGDYRY